MTQIRFVLSSTFLMRIFHLGKTFEDTPSTFYLLGGTSDYLSMVRTAENISSAHPRRNTKNKEELAAQLRSFLENPLRDGRVKFRGEEEEHHRQLFILRAIPGVSWEWVFEHMEYRVSKDGVEIPPPVDMWHIDNIKSYIRALCPEAQIFDIQN